MDDAFRARLWIEHQNRAKENDRRYYGRGDASSLILFFVLVALGRWYYGLMDSYIDGETMRIYLSIFLCFLSLVFYEILKAYVHVLLGLLILVGFGIEIFKIFF
jgi:hypothetical protein